MQRNWLIRLSFILLVIFISLACRQSVQPMAVPTILYNPATPTVSKSEEPDPTQATLFPLVRRAGDLTITSPTPDIPLELPEIRVTEDHYVVQPGDWLGSIAARFGITIQMIVYCDENYRYAE